MNSEVDGVVNVVLGRVHRMDGSSAREGTRQVEEAVTGFCFATEDARECREGAYVGGLMSRSDKLRRASSPS